MKYPIVISLLLAKVLCLVLNLKNPIICSPSDPKDCYPKLFEPTNSWQEIKDGQEIPPGLHVRLNIDTLKKEAKFLEDDDDGISSSSSSSETTNDIVVLTGEGNDDEITDIKDNDKANDYKNHKFSHKYSQKDSQKVIPKKTNKSKHSSADLNTFGAAVDEVHSSFDVPRLTTALDTLIELSHDIEFGAKLTADRDIFRDLLFLGKKVKLAELQEKSLRIMGAALRNNPEAIENVINNQDVDFIKTIFSDLKDSAALDVIQKRILGVVQALSQNKHFSTKYFNYGRQGLNDLILVFPHLGSLAQERLINILQDSGFIEVSNKREIQENPDKEFSDFVQTSLATQKISSEQDIRSSFEALVNVHENDKNLKASKQFITWLTDEIQHRKDLQKRDQVTEEDKSFNKKLLEARHLVFGNPNALRNSELEEL